MVIISSIVAIAVAVFPTVLVVMVLLLVRVAGVLVGELFQ